MKWMIMTTLVALGCATGTVAGDPSASEVDVDGAAQSASPCADPDTVADCTACVGKSDCQPNGCYNNYVCDTQTNRCKAPTACP